MKLQRLILICAIAASMSSCNTAREEAVKCGKNACNKLFGQLKTNELRMTENEDLITLPSPSISAQPTNLWEAAESVRTW